MNFDKYNHTKSNKSRDAALAPAEGICAALMRCSTMNLTQSIDNNTNQRYFVEVGRVIPRSRRIEDYFSKVGRNEKLEKNG